MMDENRVLRKDLRNKTFKQTESFNFARDFNKNNFHHSRSQLTLRRAVRLSPYQRDSAVHGRDATGGATTRKPWVAENGNEDIGLTIHSGGKRQRATTLHSTDAEISTRSGIN